MKEVTLPSGAVLKIHPSEFGIAKALYQAILRELKGVSVQSDTEWAELYKELFCIAFSSREIEACLWECLKRCTYAGSGGPDLKITAATFEPVSAREDYIQVCMEVAKDNVLPFAKSLYAEYEGLMRNRGKSQA